MKYRKRPVEVEAIKFDGTADSSNEVLAWIGSNGGTGARMHAYQPSQGLLIRTLEGTMRANSGDYVIRGVQGEFYPCRPDIFEATYEAVESV